MFRLLTFLLLFSYSYGFAQSSYKQLDVVVIIPSEFYRNPNTSQDLGLSKSLAQAEVRTAINLANEYYKPLNVELNIVQIVNYKDNSQDPYAQHGNNAIAILEEARNLYDTYDVDYDIGLIVGRGFFNGVSGLAHTSVSCTNKKFSQVFVTVSGVGAQKEFSLAHTIAHEVGHVIGMSHDDELFRNQQSLMATNFVAKPYGFSTDSINRAARRLSGQGGECLEDILTEDIDNDGFSDELELSFGSNVSDRGSIPQIPSKEWLSTWNSFLSLTNIVELVNRSENTNTVTLELKGIDGDVLESRDYTLEPSAQFDVILNEWPNFEANSYGTISISSTELIDGRVSLYSIENGRHSFSTIIPFLKESKDITNLTFNTYYPNQASIYDHVLNWITLVNLEDFNRSFRVVTFNQLGEVVNQRLVTVAPNTRLDIEGGHENMDLARAGTHKVIPEDLDSNYIAYISRYGFGGVDKNFLSVNFASVQLAESASGSAKANNFLSRNNGYTYLEIFNSRSAKTDFNVQLFAPDSSLISQRTYTLEGYKQLHLSLTDDLASLGHEYGSFVIEPEDNESINTQLYVYEFINRFDGFVAGNVITANLALQNIIDRESSIFNSYNLFLNASNFILLSNYSDSDNLISIEQDSNLVNQYNLEANQTMLVDLRELEYFANRDSTYGALEINSEASLGASIVRRGDTAEFSNLMLKSNFR